MNAAGNPLPPAGIARAVARHSLGWLVAANVVGVWLAVTLLWPALGDALAPLTYGRWMPLHLDWQLYGWSALPLAGVLVAWFAADRAAGPDVAARWVLRAWSLALGLGGVSWLAGEVSGKLFLDWSGPVRPLLPAAMLGLWAVLAREMIRCRRQNGRGGWLARGALLLGLLPVPGVLFWASGRTVYPAVNPDSGGATGAALLGSTLGVVTILLLLPGLLRLRQLVVSRQVGLGVCLAVSWVVFAVMGHGHASHHALGQIGGLAVLLAWVPLLAVAWRGVAWPAEARPWLLAALAWWALLVASGWISFLPRISELLKFTHGLVAHAHLAMAGVVTSVNGMMLTTLARRATPPGAFAAWHVGCAVQVVALLVLGGVEAGRADELFRSETWTQALLGARLGGGVLMTAASIRWFADSWRA